MSLITVCDGGCGRQSPDPDPPRGEGPHRANSWVRIRYGVNAAACARHTRAFDSRRDDEDRLYCEECWAKVAEAMKLAEDRP